MRHRLLLTILLISLTTSLFAQVVHITGNLYLEMRGLDGKRERVALSVPIYIFDRVAEARQQATLYRQQASRQGEYTTM